jgi:predicted metal-dependent hydrolase
VTLALDARRGASPGATLLELAAHDARRRLLRVGLPPSATREQLREAVQGWLQRQARRVFEERCEHYAPLLKVRVRRIALSSAQTRWGSASIDGSVRLNWRLIHFALPTIDYVVAHELAHLRHMDHSPQFWGVVRSVIPDVEAARGRLKDDVLPVFE